MTPQATKLHIDIELSFERVLNEQVKSKLLAKEILLNNIRILISRLRDWSGKLQARLLQCHEQHSHHVDHHGDRAGGALRSRPDDFRGAVLGPRQAPHVCALPLRVVSSLLCLVRKKWWLCQQSSGTGLIFPLHRWAYINYYNDDYFDQFFHQLFFTVTELVSTVVTVHLVNKDHQVTPRKVGSKSVELLYEVIVWTIGTGVDHHERGGVAHPRQRMGSVCGKCCEARGTTASSKNRRKEETFSFFSKLHNNTAQTWEVAKKGAHTCMQEFEILTKLIRNDSLIISWAEKPSTMYDKKSLTVESTHISGHARHGLHVAGRLAPVDTLVRTEGDVAAQGSAALALDHQPRVCRRRRLRLYTLGSVRPHKELIVSQGRLCTWEIMLTRSFHGFAAGLITPKRLAQGESLCQKYRLMEPFRINPVIERVISIQLKYNTIMTK